MYGSAEVPITESTQTGIGITNAYGRTKHMIEEILKDFVHSKTIEHSSDTQSAASSSEPWRVTILRLVYMIFVYYIFTIHFNISSIFSNKLQYYYFFLII